MRPYGGHDPRHQSNCILRRKYRGSFGHRHRPAWGRTSNCHGWRREAAPATADRPAGRSVGRIDMPDPQIGRIHCSASGKTNASPDNGDFCPSVRLLPPARSGRRERGFGQEEAMLCNGRQEGQQWKQPDQSVKTQRLIRSTLTILRHAVIPSFYAHDVTCKVIRYDRRMTLVLLRSLGFCVFIFGRVEADRLLKQRNKNLPIIWTYCLPVLYLGLDFFRKKRTNKHRL